MRTLTAVHTLFGNLHILACFPSVVVGLLLQVRGRTTTAAVPRHLSKFAWLFPSAHSWYPCPPAGLSTWGRLVIKTKPKGGGILQNGWFSSQLDGLPLTSDISLSHPEESLGRFHMGNLEVHPFIPPQGAVTRHQVPVGRVHHVMAPKKNPSLEKVCN